MSWLYSRALVAEYSAATCSAGELSAPSNGNPIPQAYCAPDKMTAFSRLSRYGMTFEPLTEDLGAAVLMWCQEASRVRTSVRLGGGQALTARAAACGAKWRELSVKFCRGTSSWRTHLCLWDEALPWSSVTLPRWGMTRNGVVLRHPTSERPISETASGLWQTPVADDACNRAAGKWNSRGEPKLSAQVIWPTPTASLGTKGGRVTPRKGREGGTLIEAVSERMWPTPKANDGEKRGNFDVTNPRNGLPAAVKRYPTPTVNDSKNSTLPPSQIHHDNLPGALLRDGEAPGGQLNPQWVEWLMGWPPGWSDLKPLAMDKFREWQQQHGGF